MCQDTEAARTGEFRKVSQQEDSDNRPPTFVRDGKGGLIANPGLFWEPVRPDFSEG